MRRIEPDLLASIIERAATQVAAEMNPGMGLDALQHYAQGLVDRDWFRGTVEAAVDAYRFLGGQDDGAEEKLARNGGGSMTDLEIMSPGVQALHHLRQAGVDQFVEMVWVVPLHLLAGLHWAYGLRIVRSPEATRPTLALQWGARAFTTPSNEEQKGA